MILRIPDYFEQFHCIADKCKDSCCIGWEIDIDEETKDYYLQQKGEIKRKFEQYMYITEEGEYSLELMEDGKCPFLTEKGLCQLCMELGEEALSEVCTEYPRFSLEYGNVLQKCLSLSCEEAGRILFEKDDVVNIVDRHMDWDDPKEEETEEFIEFLEKVQNRALVMLQNREEPLKLRLQRFYEYLSYVAEQLAQEEGNLSDNFEENKICDTVQTEYRYVDFVERFSVFEEMEVLGMEWEEEKKNLLNFFSEENYESYLKAYVGSTDYKEVYYEKLLVYFFFRYFMNSVYDFNVVRYGKLAIVFTLVIRDMNAMRYHKQGGVFKKEDMIDDVRVFSKEVEHSEENVELAGDAILFDEVYEWKRLEKQIC